MIYSVLSLVTYAFILLLIGHPIFFFFDEKIEDFWRFFHKEAAPNLKRLTVLFFIVAYWLLGALIFMHMENWDYFTSIYFTYLTLSTIGFGEIVVQNISTRLFLVFYSLIGVGMDTLFISYFVNFMHTQTLKNLKDNSIRQ